MKKRKEIKKTDSSEWLLIILASLAAVVGLAMVGIGFTGKVILNDTRPLCTEDTDCNMLNNEVCCLFYHEAAGVCHQPEMCQKIEDITKYEKVNAQQAILEDPRAIDYHAMAIVLGALSLSICLFLLFIYATGKGPEEKKKKRPANKAKKKGSKKKTVKKKTASKKNTTKKK